MVTHHKLCTQCLNTSDIAIDKLLTTTTRIAPDEMYMTIMGDIHNYEAV